MNMKLKLFYILSLFCILFTACSEDEPIVSLSQKEFNDIPCEGATYEIKLETGADWTATSLTEWCKVVEEKGIGSSSVNVIVKGNIRGPRTGEVVIYSNGEKQSVYFNQLGLDEGATFTYKIPVIFHVIYNDASDKKQNPDTETIYNLLKDVNEFYGKALGDDKGLKLEFTLVQFDPKGNKLAEAGIERIKWGSATLDPEDVMGNNTKKYTHFIWDPNEYVNILLYNFSQPYILGISTFPLTTKAHPLPGGGDVVDNMNIAMENLKNVRGVSINSSYIYNGEDQLVDIVPEELKPIFSKQTSVSVTLAHELGHYFGLRHVFSESNDYKQDTDYCTDTKSYDRKSPKGYEASLSMLLDQAIAFNNWDLLFQRTSLEGLPFEAHNIMDYNYCYMDEITPQQVERVRHVLLYSPMIPGPKDTRDYLSRGNSVEGPVDLPITLSDGYPLFRPLK